MICAAGLSALQPIFADSIWWHVARGREALSFNLLPSASLLIADTLAEADWLSGVPTMLAFDLGGLHGLMLLQLLLAVFVAVLLIRATSGPTNTNAWLVLPALIIVCNRSLPVPASLTLVAIPLLWHVANDFLREPTSAHLVKLFITVVIAVNFAPGILWLFATVVIAGFQHGESRLDEFARSRIWQSSSVALVASCLNPRGVFAIRDAFVLTFPQANVSRAYLVGTQFDVLASSADRLSTALFVALTLLIAFKYFAQRAHPAEWSCLAILQFAAWSCARNLLPVTVLLLLLCGVVKGNPATGDIWQTPARLRRLHPPVFSLTMVLLIAVCVSGVVGQDRRLGWGVAPHLDYRPLQRDLTGLEIEGSVRTDDVLGTGVVSFLQLPGIQAHDTPERALLGGRWIARWHFWDDITNQRRNPYERDDGTTGGWWSSLLEDDIKLLVINSRHHKTIRALEETSWRMLSMDSPVIPYGFSGDPEMVAPILNCWDSRLLVNNGTWRYDFPGAAVEWGRTDFVDAIGGDTLTDECRRLAGVFQTLSLEHAAAKVLTASLATQPSLQIIDQLCELKWRQAIVERVQASQSSVWTRWLATYRGTRSSFRKSSWGEDFGLGPDGRLILPDGSHEGLSIPVESWRKARTFYFQGRLDKALDVFKTDDPDTLYARSQLLLEMGRPDEAFATLRSRKMTVFSQHDRILSALVTHELQFAK